MFCKYLVYLFCKFSADVRHSALGIYLDYFLIVRDIRWLRCVQQKYLRCFASIRDALARDGEFLAIGMQKENHCLDKRLLAFWDARSDLIDGSSAANDESGVLRGPVIIN